MNYIEWKRIEYKTNKNDILTNINGYAIAGKILCFLGSSGAGKTCLMDIIVGERKLTSGNIVLDSYDRISYVNQNIALQPFQTILETLNFYNRLMNKNPISDDIIINYITEFGLYDKKDMLVGSTGTNRLSGGEKKRLSILCGLVMDPNILLLDEPTSGLDAKYALKVMNFIKNYIQEKNIICICSVHQPRREIWELIDDVLILNKGKQIYFGSQKNVKTLLTTNYENDNNISDVDLILDSVDTLINNESINYNIQSYDLENNALVIPNEKEVKISPSLIKKVIILLRRNILLYFRNIDLLFLKFLLVVLIGIVEMVVLGSGSYILDQLIIKRTLFSCLRFITFCIVKVFNVSILPISSISLFFDTKDIYENELRNKLYNSHIHFAVTTFIETIIQMITSISYATVTWIPKSDFYGDYYFLYLLVIMIQTFNANALIQCVVSLVKNRDLSLIIISGYLSFSFLLLIGANINYHNEFFGMLQFVSFLKYPITILLLKLLELSDYNDNLKLLITGMNINSDLVYKLDISGHFIIMIGVYLILNLISYISISRKYNI